MSRTLSRTIVVVPEFVAKATTDVAAVLAVHGHEAGQYMVLGPDPWQVVWNHDRSGFIPFLEARRCLLVWRSPVARDSDQGALLAQLIEYAESRSKPLFAIEVNETTRAAGVDFGMTAIWTGYESYLDLATWSLAGGRRQKVRWARNHAERLGVHWREARPQIDAEDRASIQRVQTLWQEERPERRTDSFLRTDVSELMSIRRYFVAGSSSHVIAFAACTPVSQRGWYLQDVVREPDAPRGALEGAMALALDTFRDEGFEVASNGPLPFWKPDEEWNDQYQLGALGNRVMKYFDSQYRFGGINQFRAKFEPDRTKPLYVLRSRRLITPSIARSLTKVLNKRMS